MLFLRGIQFFKIHQKSSSKVGFLLELLPKLTGSFKLSFFFFFFPCFSVAKKRKSSELFSPSCQCGSHSNGFSEPRGCFQIRNSLDFLYPGRHPWAFVAVVASWRSFPRKWGLFFDSVCRLLSISGQILDFRHSLENMVLVSDMLLFL